MIHPVSVFVGGAQKSGTRSITAYFRQHPQLAVHQKKEGHFFDQDQHFTDDIPHQEALETYHSDFTVDSNTTALCDITPDYIFRQAAVKRIHSYNPNATWIILLRNPVERAYSAWNMEVNRQAEDLSFEDALISELGGNPETRSHDRFQYLARSQYHTQLLNLWRYFPKSQCHIYPAEMIWQKPQETLHAILNVLNVDINNDDSYQHVHKGRYNSKLSDAARSLLMEHLQFERTELPALLGWQHNPWSA